jgi:CMP-N-acetylneuraminate monooxygenase
MNKITINYAGSFNRISESKENIVRYDIKNLTPGINFQEHHIIKLNAQNGVDWVINRLCDHANGLLQPCAERDTAECPLHGWRLDLNDLHYKNVDVKKQTSTFDVINDVIEVHQHATHLQLPDDIKRKQQQPDISVRFLAHACLLIKCGGLNIITDPWLKGPCFLNGWWHKPCPSDDAMEQLFNADLVYLSHNHPDHTHDETLIELQKHRPDIPILIPRFKSMSAEWPVRKLGFTNINPLPFNHIFRIGSGSTYISLFKSGDFRDDRGIYVTNGERQILATVDSSILNRLVLPMNIDLLACSFSGGASGYPWCFDHYSEAEKSEIALKRHHSVKQSIIDNISACNARSFLPYAGYFEESAQRDRYIKENNRKISCDEIRQVVHHHFPDLDFIDPVKTDHITVSDNIKSTKSNIQRKPVIDQDTVRLYLDRETQPEPDMLINELYNYFSECEFEDELVLFLQPCSAEFEPYARGDMADFSTGTSTKVSAYDDKQLANEYKKPLNNTRKLFISVRASRLWEVITHRKSWEELSIGFHCRIHRTPDVYNSRFWYHFSNIYIQH